MKFKSLRAPNSSWKKLLALSVTALMTAVSAYASPSINVSPASMFRPRGMVRVQLIPGGPIDYWVGRWSKRFLPPG